MTTKNSGACGPTDGPPSAAMGAYLSTEVPVASSSFGTAHARSASKNVIDLTKDDFKPPMVSDTVMRVLKVGKEEMKRMSVGNQTRYVCLLVGIFLEESDIMPRRIQMWDWMVACLMKDKERGPFYHLCEHVNKCDVAGLYETLLFSFRRFKIS